MKFFVGLFVAGVVFFNPTSTEEKKEAKAFEKPPVMLYSEATTEW